MKPFLTDFMVNEEKRNGFKLYAIHSRTHRYFLVGVVSTVTPKPLLVRPYPS